MIETIIIFKAIAKTNDGKALQQILDAVFIPLKDRTLEKW